MARHMAAKKNECRRCSPPVATDGVVKARFVDPDYRKRMAIEDILAAVRQIAS